MATTPARMFQRRRTQAQFASENPVLAAGEIATFTGSGQVLLKIGDGTTAWNSLPGIVANDYIRVSAGAAFTTGTATLTSSNGWAGVNLPAAGTSGIAYAVSLPPEWLTANLSWGYVPLASGGLNVRWQAQVRRIGALGFGGAGNTLITDSPQVSDVFTQAAGTQFQMEHVFNRPTGFSVVIPAATFGAVVQVSIERLGDDAADTHAGALMLTNFSLVRAS